MPENPYFMASIYTMASQKGGVGKTTTSAALAAAYQEQGKRVLAVDLDPQGGLTIAFGFAPEALQKTMYHVLTGQAPLESIIIPTKISGISLAPANLDLAGAEAELIGEIGWDRTLKEALEPVLDHYDYILLDCPPTLGLLTTNALVAAHTVIVPIECEFLALQALKQLQAIITKVRQKVNPGLELRILRTMYDARTLHGREVFEEIARVGGELVFPMVIKRTVKFADSTAAGEPILLYAKDSEAADAYRQVAAAAARV